MESNNKNNSNPSSPTIEEKKELERILEENAEPQNKNSPEYHLNRILNTKFLNPFEVLSLSPDSSDDQIKRKYRSLTLLIHPDKCKLPNASDAFHILEQSYKSLIDPDKKQYYQRIMREAKERVEMERDRVNKMRVKKGLCELPIDNLEAEIRTTMQNIINEIEEKKKDTEKKEFAYKKRERDIKEEEYEKEEKEKEYKRQWESFRDKRVKSWNRFKSKITNGKSKGKYEIKPPKNKIEERVDEQHITIFRPNTII